MTDYQIKETYKNWMSRPLPADLKAELESIAGDSEAVSDRFYRDLAFGTGGLRGVANSHFLRTAGPHFPDNPGHIKRTALETSRTERRLCPANQY